MTTENTQQPIKVSDMIRTTAENQADFLTQIANHIDKLEDSIVQLTNRISDLESKTDDLK
jgi:methyl-accepting chemotaxis protein